MPETTRTERAGMLSFAMVTTTATTSISTGVGADGVTVTMPSTVSSPVRAVLGQATATSRITSVPYSVPCRTTAARQPPTVNICIIRFREHSTSTPSRTTAAMLRALTFTVRRPKLTISPIPAAVVLRSSMSPSEQLMVSTAVSTSPYGPTTTEPPAT